MAAFTFVTLTSVNRRHLLIGLLFVMAAVGPLSLTLWHNASYAKYASDSVLAMSWSGFGPEKGLYNFTVVTALLDIGRGDWSHQRRSYNSYLLYMQRVLRLDVNLVVFVEPKGRPFIEWMRRGRENRTHIVNIKLSDLPYYRYRDRIQEIMASGEYRRDNKLFEGANCEARVPEYDILQLSKLYFMDRSVRENFFNTNYFAWMDAGYGHGRDIHPKDGVWFPNELLFNYPDQVTFIERPPGALHFLPQEDQLHKLSINILAGLFFAGGGEAFKQLYKLQRVKFKEWMKAGVIDDDQTMYMLLYYRQPHLFHLVGGDWFDVFKLFNKLQRT